MRWRRRSGERLSRERDPHLPDHLPHGGPDAFGEINGAHSLRWRHRFVLPRIAGGDSERSQFLRVPEVLHPAPLRGAEIQKEAEVVCVWEVNRLENKVGFEVLLGALLG